MVGCLVSNEVCVHVASFSTLQALFVSQFSLNISEISAGVGFGFVTAGLTHTYRKELLNLCNLRKTVKDVLAAKN